MSRVVDAARLCLYAAVASEILRAPNVAGTIALLAPAHPAPVPSVTGDGASTLGWLTTAAATALAQMFGFPGLALGTALAILATLALVEWRARRVSSPPVALAAAVLVAACSLDAAHVGACAIDGFFLAALFVAFDVKGTAGLIAIAVVTALWCDASPAGIFAPLFALGLAIGTLFDRASREARTRSQVAVLVSLIATLATPAFVAYPLLALPATGIDGTLGDLLPNAPYLIAPLGYQIGVAITIVTALAAGARSLRAGMTICVAIAAFLTFSAAGYVPFLAIAAAPVLAESAARFFAVVRPGAIPVRRLLAGLSVSVVAVAVVATLLAGKTLPAMASLASTPPFGALAKFASLPEPRGRLLCTKLEWCDVAERQYGIGVVADTRIAVAPEATVKAQRDITRAKKDWDAKARAAGVDAIFLDNHSGFATLLAAEGWTPYASDGTGTLFVRHGKP